MRVSKTVAASTVAGDMRRIVGRGMRDGFVKLTVTRIGIEEVAATRVGTVGRGIRDGATETAVGLRVACPAGRVVAMNLSYERRKI